MPIGVTAGDLCLSVSHESGLGIDSADRSGRTPAGASEGSPWPKSDHAGGTVAAEATKLRKVLIANRG